MSNFKCGSDDLAKRGVNAFNVAFELSATANEALHVELSNQRANGAAITQRAIDKPKTAAQWQRSAIIELSDAVKKALLKIFATTALAAATENSYSLEKLGAIGATLHTGDWSSMAVNGANSRQMALWLGKALDSELLTDQREWEAMFNGGEKVDVLGQMIARSPTQRSQCDCLADRLGMIKRNKLGHGVVAWEKLEHKAWAALEEIFDKQFAE